MPMLCSRKATIFSDLLISCNDSTVAGLYWSFSFSYHIHFLSFDDDTSTTQHARLLERAAVTALLCPSVVHACSSRGFALGLAGPPAMSVPTRSPEVSHCHRRIFLSFFNVQARKAVPPGQLPQTKHGSMHAVSSSLTHTDTAVILAQARTAPCRRAHMKRRRSM